MNWIQKLFKKRKVNDIDTYNHSIFIKISKYEDIKTTYYNNYYISIDPCVELNWWNKLLQRIGINKHIYDNSVCVYKKNSDGIFEVVNIKTDKEI